MLAYFMNSWLWGLIFLVAGWIILSIAKGKKFWHWAGLISLLFGIVILAVLIFKHGFHVSGQKNQ